MTDIVTGMAIELRPQASSGNGGYIDFHLNGTKGDYSSRIIETNDGLQIKSVAASGYDTRDESQFRNIILVGKSVMRSSIVEKDEPTPDEVATIGWVNKNFIQKSSYDDFMLKNTFMINVKDFGAKGDGQTDDTTAIRLATVFLSQTGGIVFFPPGTYLVSCLERKYRTLNIEYPEGGGNGSRTAIWGFPNVRFVGSGVGSTTIKLADDSDAHVFYFRDDLSNWSVENMTIDGNGINQNGIVDDEAYSQHLHWSNTNKKWYVGNTFDDDLVEVNESSATWSWVEPAGINVGGESYHGSIKNVVIKNTRDYGIGFELYNGEDNIVQNVIIEHPGADGIDFKNVTPYLRPAQYDNVKGLPKRYQQQNVLYNGTTYMYEYKPNAGTIMSNITIKGFGESDRPVLLDGKFRYESFKGIDIVGEAQVDNIRVEDIKPGVLFKNNDNMVREGRYAICFYGMAIGPTNENGTVKTRNARRSMISQVYIAGADDSSIDDSSVVGLLVQGDDVEVSNTFIRHAMDGIQLYSSNNKFSNISIEDCRLALNMKGTSSLKPNIKNNIFNSFTAKDCKEGMMIGQNSGQPSENNIFNDLIFIKDKRSSDYESDQYYDVMFNKFAKKNVIYGGIGRINFMKGSQYNLVNDWKGRIQFANNSFKNYVRGGMLDWVGGNGMSANSAEGYIQILQTKINSIKSVENDQAISSNGTIKKGKSIRLTGENFLRDDLLHDIPMSMVLSFKKNGKDMSQAFNFLNPGSTDVGITIDQINDHEQYDYYEHISNVQIDIPSDVWENFINKLDIDNNSNVKFIFGYYKKISNSEYIYMEYTEYGIEATIVS